MTNISVALVLSRVTSSPVLSGMLGSDPLAKSYKLLTAKRVASDVLKIVKEQLQAHPCMQQVYPLQMLFS